MYVKLKSLVYLTIYYYIILYGLHRGVCIMIPTHIVSYLYDNNM